MSIPELLGFEEGKVSINQNFIDFNEFITWSPQRKIEALYALTKDRVYGSSDFSEEKIEKSLQGFNGAYGLVKLKFQDIKRNTGGRYFDHLINVMQLLLINSKNPTIKKTIIAMCHDMIEDTDISFSTLKDIFGTYIALGILLISKKPIKDYLNKKGVNYLSEEEDILLLKSGIINKNGDFLSKKYLEKKYIYPEKITDNEKIAENLFIGSKNDFQLFEMIESRGILNFKGLISDEFHQKETYEPHKIDLEEKWAKEMYEKIDKKYKDIRNADYFSHMLCEHGNNSQIYDDIICENTPSLNKFYNRALGITLSPNLKIRLTNDEIKHICLDSIEVKFWDRIDNIQTTEIYTNYSIENINKAKRKIEETKKYFYIIAKEFDKLMGTKFYSLISSHIEKLEDFIKEIIKDNGFHGKYLKIREGVKIKIK